MMAAYAHWRLPLALTVAAIVLTSCGLSLPSAFAPSPPAPFNGGALNPPRELASFTLQRADGQRFSTADTRGRVSLFFFGYTYCPDVCPLTLLHVAQVRQQLGTRANHLDAYFVTVDPARDTPERLLAYTKGFDPAIVALTGSQEELLPAQSAFGVVAERRDIAGSSAGYFMDHTAALFLVDQDSTIRLLYPHGMAPDLITDDLKRLLPR